MDAAMAKFKDTDIPVAFLRECFGLDVETETPTRRMRPRAHFPTTNAWATWNAQWAGKSAAPPKDGGYLRVSLTFDGRRRRLKMHRVIFALVHGWWPEHEIDHANGVRSENRPDNLRAATSGENAQNRKIRADNTSGFSGVIRHKGKWTPRIGIDGRRFYLGGFDTREHAYAAYLAAKAILHPFGPVPRGAPIISIPPRIRLRAIKTIAWAARKHRDSATEWAAWHHAFLYAC
jgi:hypothetical protein